MKKIIQIRAGKGQVQSCWVVAQVLKLFLDEVKEIGIDYFIIQNIKGEENGTIQSVIIILNGIELIEFLSTWIGTIQWIGTSQFRNNQKQNNWFIQICVLELMQDFVINEKEIVFQTMRSSGPGGQNVNKVNSAVRATHKPTGLSVVSMESRSQYQNKKLAIERLKDKMQEFNLKQIRRLTQDYWKRNLNLEKENPIRVFRGADFKKRNEVKTFKSKRKQLKQNLRNELKN